MDQSLDYVTTTVSKVVDRCNSVQSKLDKIANDFIDKFSETLKQDVYSDDPELALKAFTVINKAQQDNLQLQRQLLDSLVKAKQAFAVPQQTLTPASELAQARTLPDSSGAVNSIFND